MDIWVNRFEWAISYAWGTTFPLMGVEKGPWPWAVAERIRADVRVIAREASKFERKKKGLDVTGLRIFRTAHGRGVDTFFDSGRMIHLDCRSIGNGATSECVLG